MDGDPPDVPHDESADADDAHDAHDAVDAEGRYVDPGAPFPLEPMSQEEYDFWSTQPSGPGTAPGPHGSRSGAPGSRPAGRTGLTDAEKRVRTQVLLACALVVVLVLLGGGVLGALDLG